jgi:hypothetical protein
MLVKKYFAGYGYFPCKEKNQRIIKYPSQIGDVYPGHIGHRQATKVHHMEAPSHRAGGAFPGGPRVSDRP